MSLIESKQGGLLYGDNLSLLNTYLEMRSPYLQWLITFGPLQGDHWQGVKSHLNRWDSLQGVSEITVQNNIDILKSSVLNHVG